MEPSHLFPLLLRLLRICLCLRGNGGPPHSRRAPQLELEPLHLFRHNIPKDIKPLEKTPHHLSNGSVRGGSHLFNFKFVAVKEFRGAPLSSSPRSRGSARGQPSEPPPLPFCSARRARSLQGTNFLFTRTESPEMSDEDFDEMLEDS